MSYSQESSEESDQENSGARDNGCLDKSHLNGNKRMGEVLERSPEASGRESGVRHNGNRLNGPSYGGTKSGQNGHHKVNGHTTVDKVNLLLCVFTAF